MHGSAAGRRQRGPGLSQTRSLPPRLMVIKGGGASVFRRDFTARRAGGPAAVNRVTDGHMQTLPSRELKNCRYFDTDMLNLQ